MLGFTSYNYVMNSYNYRCLICPLDPHWAFGFQITTISTLPRAYKAATFPKGVTQLRLSHLLRPRLPQWNIFFRGQEELLVTAPKFGHWSLLKNGYGRIGLLKITGVLAVAISKTWGKSFSLWRWHKLQLWGLRSWGGLCAEVKGDVFESLNKHLWPIEKNRRSFCYCKSALIF